MIMQNGKVATITVTPADPQADPPTIETATVAIEMSLPEGVGICQIIVPNSAMGGIVVGPARIIVESA